ncbi:protein PIN-LIKES 5-like isoform X3 [Cucurbita moschata]|uniref:Protein PIN-LIKES 5-like isoform X3 n=1 Tax=Cucurbita moschata TaxID=3662 RepID=A0A6J1E698_CUCMO|nr:protein PIN-LIKES 5-like isoform X3 [Cucurbita moschata]
MGLLSLLEVAFIPNLQVLLMCLVGAFLATDYSNLLPAQARASLNKVFVCLCRSSSLCSLLVSCSQIWPKQSLFRTLFHGGSCLSTLLLPSCLDGFWVGYLLSFSNPTRILKALSWLPLLLLSGFCQWTYTYHLVKTSSLRLKALEEQLISPSHASIGDLQARLLPEQNGPVSLPSSKAFQEIESQEVEGSLEKRESSTSSIWAKTLDFLRRIVQESMTPPSLGALVGFIFGAVWWLRNLVVGDNAPFRVLQDSVQLLGNGTIPCTTLIMGGNLTQGLRSSKVKPKTIVGVIAVRYFALPAIGVLVVKAADTLGCLAADPLYHFMLMVQYTTPPAMSISTMTQLFGVGQEECSVIMLWTYLVAALSLALWGAIFMWILS